MVFEQGEKEIGLSAPSRSSYDFDEPVAFSGDDFVEIFVSFDFFYHLLILQTSQFS